MPLITNTNKDTLTKKATTYAIAGAVFVATLATSIGIYHGLKNRAASRPERIRNKELHNNFRTVEKAIESNELNLAAKYMNTFVPEKDLTPADYIKLKSQLEQGFILRDINRNLDAGREDSAKLLLSKNRAIFSESTIRSIEDKIYDTSEEGAYNNFLSYAYESNKPYLCKEYISKFPHGKHLGEMTTYLIETELSNLVNQNSKTSFESKRSSLMNLCNILESYKNNGAKLDKSFLDETLKQLYSDTVTQYVPVKKFKNLDVGMTVMVKNNPLLNHDITYLNERIKNIPEGSIGKIVGKYSDESISIIFDNVAKCNWSRSWNMMSAYWKDDKRNVADFALQEIYSGDKKFNSMDQSVIVKELDKVKALLLENYTAREK